MKKQDIEKLDSLKAVLDKEGFRGCYDGEQARLFWKAVTAIEKAMRVLIPENNSIKPVNDRHKKGNARKGEC